MYDLHPAFARAFPVLDTGKGQEGELSFTFEMWFCPDSLRSYGMPYEWNESARLEI